MNEQEVEAVVVNYASEELGSEMEEIKQQVKGEEGQVTLFCF